MPRIFWQKERKHGIYIITKVKSHGSSASLWLHSCKNNVFLTNLFYVCTQLFSSFQAPECCVTNQLDGCLPCLKHPNVESNLFWSHFLNSLHATVHMIVQVHLQVMHPPHGSHDPLDQWPIEDFIYSCFPPLLFVSHISHWDPMLVFAPCWGDGDILIWSWISGLFSSHFYDTFAGYIV